MHRPQRNYPSGSMMRSDQNSHVSFEGLLIRPRSSTNLSGRLTYRALNPAEGLLNSAVVALG